MKKNYLIALIMLSIMLSCSGTYAQSLFRTYNGERENFNVSLKRILVGTDSPEALKRITNNRYVNNVKELDDKLYEATVNSQADESSILEFIEGLEEIEGINYISPILLNDKGQEIGGITNRLIIRIKDGVEESKLEKLLSDNNCIITSDALTF